VESECSTSWTFCTFCTLFVHFASRRRRGRLANPEPLIRRVYAYVASSTSGSLVPADLDAARARCERPEQASQQRRLAASVRATDGEPFAFGYREAEAAEHLDSGELAGELLDEDHGWDFALRVGLACSQPESRLTSTS